MLCALDMSVHSTYIVYGVESPCRGFHTLVMGLSAATQIALHWCAVTPHYMRVYMVLIWHCIWCSIMWAWEWDEVKFSSIVLNENGK